MEVVMVVTELSEGRVGCAGFWFRKNEAGIKKEIIMEHRHGDFVDKIINLYHICSNTLLGTALQTFQYIDDHIDKHPLDSIFCAADGIVIKDIIVVEKEDLIKKSD